MWHAFAVDTYFHGRFGKYHTNLSTSAVDFDNTAQCMVMQIQCKQFGGEEPQLGHSAHSCGSSVRGVRGRKGPFGHIAAFGECVTIRRSANDQDNVLKKSQ